MDFVQTCIETPMGHEKKGLDFGDLDLIFKVAPAIQILTKQSLSAPYLLNQMMDSGQTLCIVSLG